MQMALNHRRISSSATDTWPRRSRRAQSHQRTDSAAPVLTPGPTTPGPELGRRQKHLPAEAS